MMIPVELCKIVISENSSSQVIWLKEEDGDRNFPIIIGFFEAMAIERNIKEKPYIRPLTHDLLAGVLQQLGGTLERVEVTKIEDSTFYANLVIAQNGDTIEMDCRPSDAIALATGLGSPIFVAEAVLDKVSVPGFTGPPGGPVPDIDIFDLPDEDDSELDD